MHTLFEQHTGSIQAAITPNIARRPGLTRATCLPTFMCASRCRSAMLPQSYPRADSTSVTSMALAHPNDTRLH
jgi:hypothetical protein